MSSYSETKQEKLEKRRELVNKVMLIPIALLLIITPLIIGLNYVKPKDGRMNILFGKVNLDDYYSQYKMIAILILTVIMVLTVTGGKSS